MTKKEIKRILSQPRMDEMIEYYEEIDFIANEYLFGEDDEGNSDGTWWYEGCHLDIQTERDATFEIPVYNIL